MTLADAQNPDQPDQDQARPEIAPADFDAKLAKSIQDWTEKAKQVEAARRENQALRITNDAIDDLSELRRVGMEHAERTGREARGLLTYDERDAIPREGADPALKFTRLARAVRQIIVLQQELLGNRPVAVRTVANDAAANAHDAEAESDREPDERERDDLADYERPERDDIDDLYDYDDRPYDQVVDGIRQTLGVPTGRDVDADDDLPDPPPASNGRRTNRPTNDDDESTRWRRISAMTAALTEKQRQRGPP